MNHPPVWVFELLNIAFATPHSDSESHSMTVCDAQKILAHSLARHNRQPRPLALIIRSDTQLQLLRNNFFLAFMPVSTKISTGSVRWRSTPFHSPCYRAAVYSRDGTIAQDADDAEPKPCPAVDAARRQHYGTVSRVLPTRSSRAFTSLAVQRNVVGQ